MLRSHKITATELIRLIDDLRSHSYGRNYIPLTSILVGSGYAMNHESNCIDLTGLYLAGIDLRNIDLTEADLRGSCLPYARLGNTKFVFAWLDSTDFSNCKNGSIVYANYARICGIDISNSCLGDIRLKRNKINDVSDFVYNEKTNIISDKGDIISGCDAVKEIIHQSNNNNNATEEKGNIIVNQHYLLKEYLMM